MLNVFRQGGFIQVLMGGVVVLIIATFAISMGDPGGGSLASDRVCVAKVDGTCVSQTDYDANYRLAVFPGVPAKQLKALGFPRDVLEGLIERELLFQQAERLGVSVSDERVDDELFQGRFRYSLPADRYAGRTFLRPARVQHSKTGQFDYNIYKREVVNLTRMTPKEFKARQHREIVADRVRNLITSQVRVSDGDAFAEFERENSKLTADVASVTVAWFARYAVALDALAIDQLALAEAARVQAEWEKQKSNFTPGCPLVARVQVSFEPGSSDEDKQERHVQIEAARERLLSGEDFAQLAREFGSDPVSFAGGSLGCVGSDRASQPLRDAAAKLAVGQVSEIIESETGFHLIRVEGTVPADAVEQVGRALVTRQVAWATSAERLARKFAEELIERADAQAALRNVVDDLARTYVERTLPAGSRDLPSKLARALADSTAPELDTARDFTILGNPVPKAKLPHVASLAFAVAEVGQLIPTPLDTENGFAVLEVTERNLTTRVEFDAQRLEIKKELQQIKGAEALRHFVARLRKRADTKIEVNDEFLAQVAAENDASDG